MLYIVTWGKNPHLFKRYMMVKKIKFCRKHGSFVSKNVEGIIGGQIVKVNQKVRDALFI